jgi:prepilin-type N-terminal cleavage/methylation domain-containing protein
MFGVKRDNGFTLIELLIVVALIGILASICIIQYDAYRMRSCNAAAVSDANSFRTSMESYFSEHNAYP